MNKNKGAALFSGWDEALIWSCLQGYMGDLVLDNEEAPSSAMIHIGDFCFFAGNPNIALLNILDEPKLLIPRDKNWEELIEDFYGRRVNKVLPYAIKKEPQEAFEMARMEEWSADLCSQFKDYKEYQKKGIGTAIFHQGKLVAGASPYAVYNGGIEIEIDTKPEHRGKGLATVCGAKLILECLQRNLYPSWDAHDLRSVALAEKLGYHLDHPYVTYELLAK